MSAVDDQMKLELQNNSASAVARILQSGEGPYEVTLRVKNKKTKRVVSVRAVYDLPGTGHYRADKSSLRIEIPVKAIQNASLAMPDFYEDEEAEEREPAPVRSLKAAGKK